MCTCAYMQPVYFQSILNYGISTLIIHCLIAAVLLVAELSASVYLVYS